MLAHDRQKRIVRDGYNAVSQLYRGDEDDSRCSNYHQWLDELVPMIPAGAAVLDLGCGNGIPVAKRLASSFNVTGVDISEVQIERARANVPNGRFICSDMTKWTCSPRTFDVIVSFYAVIHVPLAEQRALFEKLYRWLRIGGHLMVIVGHEAYTGEEPNWLGSGAPMHWSHADHATYESWLMRIGFATLWLRFVPEGTGGHVLILARR